MEGPPKKPSEEKLPQMSPEDIAEMRSQIPILKEMLEERKARVARLENEPLIDRAIIDILKEEIEELEYEIAGREEE